MKVYDPRVEVRLVKAFQRRDMSEGDPIAHRLGNVRAIDLTPLLGEAGGVRTMKGVREPAGAFQITLADKPIDQTRETVYALIEPMDLIEIRFAHDPREYGATLPVVMRGLVSSVTRSEAMSGGKPVRTVSITGHDFGKILQIFQIFYLNNSVIGDNLLTELAFFQKYAEGGDARIRRADEFVANVLDKVINPYLKRMTSLANGDSVGARIINQWSSSVTIEGCVSPFSIVSFNDVSVHQFLSSLLDIGPFNEMYVEDLADSVRLVVRPAPVLDTGMKPIQGVYAESMIVEHEDIVSMSVSRTDAGVANYYWVQSSPWSLYTNEEAKLHASVGSQGSFIKFDYMNCAASRYGIRKMEISTRLLPPGYVPSDSAKREEIESGKGAYADWLERRRTLLAEINKDNVVFEHGTLRVRGNERIKAGMQIYLRRGSNFSATFYVTQVEHEYTPFRCFISTLTLERGTSFAERSKADVPQYFIEMDSDGVS